MGGLFWGKGEMHIDGYNAGRDGILTRFIIIIDSI